MNKRRKGYPSEQRVKRGRRIVNGNKELFREAGTERLVSVRLRTPLSSTAA